MTVVLHRFPLSHFSEKGRALLAFKKLPFRIQDHQLGWPQLGIYRLSGQRKVPVVEDDGRVVADSTAIALYLEERYPEPRLLPEDPEQRREVLALEDRLDHWMGSYAPVVWFDWLVRDRPDAVARFLAVEAWGVGQGRLAAAVVRRLMGLGKARRIVRKAEQGTRTLLGELCARLEKSPYLCGPAPTLADAAAAGLAYHLEIPRTRDLAIPEWAGMAVPGIADAPEFARFFAWRRDFYARHLE